MRLIREQDNKKKYAFNPGRSRFSLEFIYIVGGGNSIVCTMQVCFLIQHVWHYTSQNIGQGCKTLGWETGTVKESLCA